jgi:hypothetical protein
MNEDQVWLLLQRAFSIGPVQTEEVFRLMETYAN